MRDASHHTGGYIRLYRSLLEWEWFQDSATLHVFLFLLLSACFRPIRHAGVELAPGQLITARRTIAQKTGLTEQKVRTALRHLESTREITIKPTNQFSLITLTHFAHYQELLSPAGSSALQPAINRRSTGKPPNNKNDNHVNQEKKKGDPSPYEYGKEYGNGNGPFDGIGLCV